MVQNHKPFFLLCHLNDQILILNTSSTKRSCRGNVWPETFCHAVAAFKLTSSICSMCQLKSNSPLKTTSSICSQCQLKSNSLLWTISCICSKCQLKSNSLLLSIKYIGVTDSVKRAKPVQTMRNKQIQANLGLFSSSS